MNKKSLRGLLERLEGIEADRWQRKEKERTTKNGLEDDTNTERNISYTEVTEKYVTELDGLTVAVVSEYEYRSCERYGADGGEFGGWGHKTEWGPDDYFIEISDGSSSKVFDEYDGINAKKLYRHIENAASRNLRNKIKRLGKADVK